MSSVKKAKVNEVRIESGPRSTDKCTLCNAVKRLREEKALVFSIEQMFSLEI